MRVVINIVDFDVICEPVDCILILSSSLEIDVVDEGEVVDVEFPVVVVTFPVVVLVVVVLFPIVIFPVVTLPVVTLPVVGVDVGVAVVD